MFFFPSRGQRVGAIHVDTSWCDGGYNNLKLTDVKVLTALHGAEEYIRSIVGNELLQNNIWLAWCASREVGFQVYAKDIQHPHAVGEDTCYEFYYFAMDKRDTIADFQLLVDKNGRPVKKYDLGSDTYNQPQLIMGLKKHFTGQFKLTYTQAVEISKKKGFVIKPILECEMENKFVSDKSRNVFIKVKYYWSFYQIWDGGNEAILQINAETGKIEKEKYVPRMPG